MNRIKLLFATLLIPVLMCSCENEIVIKADNAKSYSVSLALDLGKNLYDTISTLSEFNNSSPEGNLFTQEEITAVCTNKNFTDHLIKRTDNSLTVLISPEVLKETYSSLPEENQLYLDLLMAPSLIDETMSEEEYRDLVAAIYGDDLADEMWNSKIKFTLECPSGKTIKKALQSEKNHSFSKNRATFEIPVVSLLAIQKAESFSISW